MVTIARHPSIYHMRVYAYVCVLACVYVCLYVDMYVWVDTIRLMCMGKYAQAYVGTLAQACMGTCGQAYVHGYMHSGLRRQT